jgi:hypothetical protein
VKQHLVLRRGDPQSAIERPVSRIVCSALLRGKDLRLTGKTPSWLKAAMVAARENSETVTST